MNQSNITPAEAVQSELTPYIIGFILSIILTVIPFAMVMDGTISHSIILYSIVIMGVVQIVVHLICFLHMNSASEEEWNLLALAFTLLIIGILICGSLWIMHHLDHNMMPY